MLRRPVKATEKAITFIKGVSLDFTRCSNSAENNTHNQINSGNNGNINFLGLFNALKEGDKKVFSRVCI